MRTREAGAFERCINVGGVALFPADTVYGLACDPDNRFAVQRLYLLKRRPLGKPSAVMFLDLELALAALPELGERTRAAMRALLPGAVTLLVSNPAGRFPLACGDDRSTLGVRVPRLPMLAGVSWPVLQSSANRAGGADPRRVEDVPELIRAAADLVIDGGELPGTSSTVVDLRRYEDSCAWGVVRAGAVSEGTIGRELGWQFHFDPATYAETIREEIPVFERLQDELALASGTGARRILELGTGTGETARRLLARHPEAALVGVDVSEPMLAAARDALPAERIVLRVQRLQDELPGGPFDLVASALCIHHLDAGEKADLFERVQRAMAPGGRFAIADVVVPAEADPAQTALTDGYDKPSPLADQLEWLKQAGFDARVTWEHADLAVIAAQVAA
ncbi:MAG: L-histidine N(alpha)-methyltransferase [Actinomycetota bacterium]|nr:L-histidine N(alpha)-methyltransferase [Actinomycetota bacterium]